MATQTPTNNGTEIKPTWDITPWTTQITSTPEKEKGLFEKALEWMHKWFEWSERNMSSWFEQWWSAISKIVNLWESKPPLEPVQVRGADWDSGWIIPWGTTAPKWYITEEQYQKSKAAKDLRDKEDQAALLKKEQEKQQEKQLANKKISDALKQKADREKQLAEQQKAQEEQKKLQEEQKTLAFQQQQQTLDEILANWWGTQSLDAYFKNNPNSLYSSDYIISAYTKAQQNDFYNKYNNLSSKQLYEAFKKGEISITSKLYWLLDEDTRKNFEDYMDLQRIAEDKEWEENTDLPDWTEKDDIYDKLAKDFLIDLDAEYKKMRNDEWYIAAKDKVSAAKSELSAKDREIKAEEDRLREKYRWVPKSTVDWIINDRLKTLQTERDRIVDNYNIALWEVHDYQWEMDIQLKFLWLKNDNQKWLFDKALDKYKTDVSAMSESEKLKLQEQIAIRADARKAEIEMALYEAKKLVDAWDKELKIIDNKLYSMKKDWTDAQLVIDWDLMSSNDSKNYSVQNFNNNDWTYTSLFTNKATGQVYSVVTDINWNKTWDYLQNLWTGYVTNYWDETQNDYWLEIDWALGQSIFAPTGWEVVEIWYDNKIWNYIAVQLDDKNYIQYGHLSTIPQHIQQAYKTQWTYKFSNQEVIGQIWNSWIVYDANGELVTFSWDIAMWKWAGVNIVSYDASWLPRTARDTEAFLKQINTKTELDKEQFQMQKDIINSLKWDIEIKNFESSLIESKNLITSLWTKWWAWDLAAIFQFMKSLDPKSTVRESEFDMAWSTAWFTDQQIAKMWGLIKWDKLSEIAREDFEKLAMAYILVRAESYDRIYNDSLRLYQQQWLPESSFPARASDIARQMVAPKLITSNWDEINLVEFEQWKLNRQNSTSDYYNQ